MDRFGIFISYRHTDWAIAGRIFDFLEAKGYQPFLDTSSLRQGNFHEILGVHIRNAPYFLCVLTDNTFSCMDDSDWINKEISLALESDRSIILLAQRGFVFPSQLPDKIKKISDYHCYEFDRMDFLNVMNRMCQRDISIDKLKNVIDWRKRILADSNVCLMNRQTIDHNYATFEDRFGKDFIDCLRKGERYSGQNRIKYICMSCYAASLIFNSKKNMVDDRAFDRGMMFNIFARLFEDDEFYLEVIINAPDSVAMEDAIKNNKLGNRALEAFPEAIFLSSYCNVNKLINNDEVFKKAYEEKRFRFMVTESVLPYALFQVVYKSGFEQYDHIKVDLYSEGLVSNMDRRCMIIFKDIDTENYIFFEERYKCIRNIKESHRLIRENHAKWIDEWEKLKKEIG